MGRLTIHTLQLIVIVLLLILWPLRGEGEIEDRCRSEVGADAGGGGEFGVLRECGIRQVQQEKVEEWKS